MCSHKNRLIEAILMSAHNLPLLIHPKLCQMSAGIFYAPNFEEVEGAFWFGPVRPPVRLSVRNTFW